MPVGQRRMQITWRLCRLRYFSEVRTHIFFSVYIFSVLSRDDYNLATAANHLDVEAELIA